MNLTEHFSLEEMVASDIAVRHSIDNNPSGDIVVNLRRLAEFLEKVRLLLNKPIHINSAYRSPEVNNLLGSKPTSQHCVGCAADIRVDGMTPDEIVRTIKDSSIVFDQLIREFDSWVHISIPSEGKIARKNVLIIDRDGTRTYYTSTYA